MSENLPVYHTADVLHILHTIPYKNNFSPAVGFAVDVNSVAKVIAKNGDINSYKPVSDVIVYSAPGNEVKGIKTAGKLRAKGDVVETALFETLDAVREYAKEKKIAKIVVVEEDINE